MPFCVIGFGAFGEAFGNLDDYSVGWMDGLGLRVLHDTMSDACVGLDACCLSDGYIEYGCDDSETEGFNCNNGSAAV